MYLDLIVRARVEFPGGEGVITEEKCDFAELFIMNVHKIFIFITLYMYVIEERIIKGEEENI